MSQTEVSTSDNVYDYITKNSKVDAETLNKLLNSFNLDDIRFQQPHYTLSGGEKMKLSIVSNLLKNTPYLFLDEPTNSLDDKSVAELIVILNKYRFEKS